jgi:hypothetical protein
VIAALTLSALALEIANACASMAEPNRFAIIRPTELTRVNRANVIDQCGCTSADPAMEIAKCAPEQVEDSESHSTAWRMISR